MTPYLNPITVLRLQDTDPEGLDARVLRKAKKRFFSELLLDEREDIDYLGQHYTRHDLEAALERAEDPAWLAAYVAATAYPGLNRFLVGAPHSVRLVSAAVWQDALLQPILRTFLPAVYAAALRRAYLQDDGFACAKLFSWPVLRYTGTATAYGAVYQAVQQGVRIYRQAVDRFLDDPEDRLARQLYGAGVLREHFPRQSVRQLPEYFHDLLRAAANVTLRLIRATQRTDPALAKGHLEYASGFPGLTREQCSYFARYLPGLTPQSPVSQKREYPKKKHVAADRSYRTEFNERTDRTNKSDYSMIFIVIISVIMLIRILISCSKSEQRNKYPYRSTWPKTTEMTRFSSDTHFQ